MLGFAAVEVAEIRLRELGLGELRGFEVIDVVVFGAVGRVLFQLNGDVADAVVLMCDALEATQE